MKDIPSPFLCLVIGNPVLHSLSPLIHNTGYEALGIKAYYAPCEVQPEQLEAAILGARALNIRGMSVTLPFKEQLVKFLDQIDPLAARVGAVNTVVNDSGKLIGYNTDCYGITQPLKELGMSLKGANIAVLGSGGAARAAVIALSDSGSICTIISRNKSSGSELAKLALNNNYLTSTEELSNQHFNIVINCTPLGMGKYSEECPFPINLINPKTVYFDLVYHPLKTVFLKNAEEVGAKTINGLEMLIAQAIKQFKLFTNRDAPIDKIKERVFAYLSKS